MRDDKPIVIVAASGTLRADHWMPAMNNLPYKFWRWASAERKRLGSGEMWSIGVSSKAKHHPTNPREVANELLAMRLGLFIGLPIPVGVPVKRQKKWYWASLDVAPGQDDLPHASDADISAILENLELATGIIVFDSWIMNEDRIKANISYDDENEQTFAFDHGRAFDVFSPGELKRSRSDICLGKHCLCNIGSLSWFDDWHEKILSIPERFIYDSVKMTTNFGRPESDINTLTECLVLRRARLREIFRDHNRAVFPRINYDLFTSFKSSPDHYQI